MAKRVLCDGCGRATVVIGGHCPKCGDLTECDPHEPTPTAATDWVLMSVPGRDQDPDDATRWFAFNRLTRKSLPFPTAAQAAAFVNHPDNAKGS